MSDSPDLFGHLEPELAPNFVAPEPNPEHDPFNIAIRLLILLRASNVAVSKERLGILYFFLTHSAWELRLSVLNTTDDKKLKNVGSFTVPPPRSFSDTYAMFSPWRQLYEDGLAILAARNLVAWSSRDGAFVFYCLAEGHHLLESLPLGVWQSLVARSITVCDTLGGKSDHALRVFLEHYFPSLYGWKGSELV